jgi:hypothetical protein
VALVAVEDSCLLLAYCSAFGSLVEAFRNGYPVANPAPKGGTPRHPTPEPSQLGIIVGCVIGGMALIPVRGGIVFMMSAGVGSIFVVYHVFNLLRNLALDREPWATPPAPGSGTPEVGGWAFWTVPLWNIPLVYKALYDKNLPTYTAGLVAYLLTLPGFVVLYCLSGELTKKGISIIHFPQYTRSQTAAISGEMNRKWGLNSFVKKSNKGFRVEFAAMDQPFFRSLALPRGYGHLRPPPLEAPL